MKNLCNCPAISTAQLTEWLQIFAFEVQLVFYAELKILELLRQGIVVVCSGRWFDLCGKL